MKIINLTQRGEGWHEWRQRGVTATDAIVLVGRSPYKTPWRLWAEKTGYALPEDLSNNPNVQRGVELEDSARMAVEAHWGDILLPVCVESSANPILRASLDGLNSAGEPVELKCPAESTWQQVERDGERSEAYQLYYPQVQHQINVTGASRGWMVFYFEGAIKVFEVARDQGLIQEIEAKAEVFWKAVEKKKEPPKDPMRDVFIPKGSDVANWIYAAEEYRLYEAEILTLKARMDELREKQASTLDVLKGMMADYYNADYCGVKITKYTVAGRIDYKKILEQEAPNLSAVDIEKFREAREVRCRVSITDSLTPKLIIDPEVIDPVKDLPKEIESFYW